MRFLKGEFVRFVIVGCLNTGFYYAIYLLCLHVFSLHYLAAHFIGFFISMVGSFFLNTYFTYKVKPTLIKFLKFPITQLANTVLSAVFLFVLVEWMHVSSTFAPIVAVFFTVPITFIITGKILKGS